MSDAVLISGAEAISVSSRRLRLQQAGEVLIDVKAVGICGSDLHYYKDGGIGSAIIRAPFVPGHEFCGCVCEDIPEKGIKKGDLVAVDPNQSCGECEWCGRGHPNLCPHVRFIGAPPFDGAMTDQIFVPKSQIVALPASIDAEEAVMLEPLGVAIHAIDLAKPSLLECVAVIGCGPIGLLIIGVLKVLGIDDIYACDPLPHRRSAAKRMGARWTGQNVAELQGTEPSGLPLVIEATNSPDGFRDAVAAARIGGRVVLVGIPDGNIYTLPAAEARRRGLNIKFARRMGDVYPRAIELVTSGKINVKTIISHRIGLSETPAAFRALAANAPGYLKVLVIPKRTTTL